MKRKLWLLAVLVLCLVLAVGILAACNGSGGSGQQTPGGENPGTETPGGEDPGTETPGDNPGGEDPGDETVSFIVTFDTQGGSVLADITVENGQVIGEFTLPTKQCSRLVGFALDTAGEQMWNVLTDTVSANITLYAIWEDAHTWGEWADTTPATCTENGERTRECEVCDKTESEAIDALGHDYAEEYTVDVIPTCEGVGSESRHCTRCDATTDSREVAALGHDTSSVEWISDSEKHWKICGRCNNKTEMAAHDFGTTGICVCGVIEDTPLGEFTFTSLSNNRWEVTKYIGKRSTVVIPSEYEGGAVTSIGSAAFEEYTDLTFVTIPDSVTSIGDEAFRGCSGLTSVTIPDSVTSIGGYAFRDCTSLTSITIPDSVTSIGNSAFEGCTGLTSVTIGNGVTSIGNWAFEDCSGLTEINWDAVVVEDFTNNSNIFYNAGTLGNGITVTLGNSVISIPNYLFYVKDSSYRPKVASVVIGENVTGIGSSSFSGCSSLTSVTIPNSVTSIGNSAFSGCDGLMSVTIPSSVTSIGSYAFSGCDGLMFVTIGNGVTSIGNYAFSGCTSLTEINWNAVAVNNFSSSSNVFNNAGTSGDGITVTFGDSVIRIPAYLFYVENSSYCPKVTNVIIGENVTSIRSYAFSDCTSLMSITIGSGVTSIIGYAFYHCNSLDSVYIRDLAAWCGISFAGENSNPLYYANNLYLNGELVTDLVLPDSVTSIGDYAFYNYDNLMSVNIPSNVKSIGDRAFMSCSSLTSVTIGSGVMSIGTSAFNSCNGLTSITVPDSVTSIGRGAFGNCGSLTSITIPFVGAEAGKTSSDTYQYPFGYIVGGASGTKVEQSYYESSTSSLTISTYYIPSSLRSVTVTGGEILSGAFRNCSMLTSITITDSTTAIRSLAFWGCSGLTSVNYIGDIAGWCGISFTSENSNPLYYAHNLYLNGELVTDLVIPDGVRSIGEFAFHGCNSLTSVIIPNSVTSIGNHAFRDCRGLTSVAIGSGVTNIGNYAFYGCTSLTSATFDVTSGWYRYTNVATREVIISGLDSPSLAATLLVETYYAYYWKRKA